MPVEGGRHMNPAQFEHMIEAVDDHQVQLDIRLDGLSLHVPYVREEIELRGSMSVSVHLRHLTDVEKEAHASHTIKRLGT